MVLITIVTGAYKPTNITGRGGHIVDNPVFSVEYHEYPPKPWVKKNMEMIAPHRW